MHWYKLGRIRNGQRITVISNGYYLLDYPTEFTRRSMGLQPDFQTINGLYQSSLQGAGPYEPSIASSASSSQVSIFSESSSVQSSIASSISDDFRYNQEDARDRVFAQQQIRQKALIDDCNASLEQAKLGKPAKSGCPFNSSYADITSVPKEQRQHPRRCSLSRNQKPPPLVRQSERKTNFVESLVGKHLQPTST